MLITRHEQASQIQQSRAAFNYPFDDLFRFGKKNGLRV